MALQDILASIKEAAAKKMAEQDHKLKTQMSEVDSVFEQKKVELNEEYEHKIKEKLEYIAKKVHSHVAMQRKIGTLNEKHSVLNTTFEEALKTLVDSKHYTDLLASLLKTVDVDKAEVIYAKGKKSETEAAIKKADKNFDIAKEGEFKGGARVVTKKAEFDFSFENLISEIRVMEESEIANTLFNV